MTDEPGLGSLRPVDGGGSFTCRVRGDERRSAISNENGLRLVAAARDFPTRSSDDDSGAPMSAAVKKKHVRFASMDDDQEEDTLFDKRKDAERGGLKSALKAAKRKTKAGCGDRVKVAGGGGRASCGRRVVSLTLCASFLGLGMAISVIGPTFEDLASNVKKDISNISYIFVGRSAGFIGGSLLGGVLFDCLNPNLLLGFSMLITSCGMCAIPFCKHALLLTGFMSGIGISLGILDTGGNVLILQTWGEQAAPHMQALHFSFAAGAFASPIIAKVLLGRHGGGAASDATRPFADGDRAAVRPVGGGEPTSMWAYVVIGLLVLLTSVPFFLLSAGGEASRDKGRPSRAEPPAARHHAALVALLFFFFFAYVGAEVAYGTFIFTFAKDFAGMSASQAAGLNSLFWATFAACRGLAIFLASRVYPGTMILLSLAGSTLSTLFLCLFSKDKATLWICTAFYGASMSSTFPGGISWLEQYTAVTGRSAAALVVGGALGEMALPALVGFLLGKMDGQPSLMYVSLGASTFTAILFPVMYKLASVGKAHGRGPPNDGEFRRALLDSGAVDEEDDEEEENEADRWNDADFEVIEMDDATSLVASPAKSASSSPNADGGAASSATRTSEPAKEASSSDAVSLVGDSPGRKLLLFADRVKRD
ncbi:sodium-dependent glucose transporter 1 [Hippocampus zosterae]|uniref:sodium-dependent glucose transporter 1 n=1 Tax=Hippocampus zosterae TaxID=109293 RepID=UPI00223CCC33|nr:sodium-dependent glucose transporter 1 [Hippocampus zosterae]